MKMNIKTIGLGLGLGLGILLATGCGSSRTSESTGQYIDNSAISTKVKTDLLTGLGTQGLDVHVKSFKGDVQLSGFVNSDTIKQKAGTIASKVSGVTSVSNNLIVK